MAQRSNSVNICWISNQWINGISNTDVIISSIPGAFLIFGESSRNNNPSCCLETGSEGLSAPWLCPPPCNLCALNSWTASCVTVAGGGRGWTWAQMPEFLKPRCDICKARGYSWAAGTGWSSPRLCPPPFLMLLHLGSPRWVLEATEDTSLKGPSLPLGDFGAMVTFPLNPRRLRFTRKWSHRL